MPRAGPLAGPWSPPQLPPNVELDDLVAYGQIGLVEARGDFDPARGNRFSTFAYYRIRGEIYDGMAKMSWFGRDGSAQAHADRLSNEVLRGEAKGDEEPETRGGGSKGEQVEGESAGSAA